MPSLMTGVRIEQRHNGGTGIWSRPPRTALFEPGFATGVGGLCEKEQTAPRAPSGHEGNTPSLD